MRCFGAECLNNSLLEEAWIFNLVQIFLTSIEQAHLQQATSQYVTTYVCVLLRHEEKKSEEEVDFCNRCGDYQWVMCLEMRDGAE